MSPTDRPLVWLHGEVKSPPFSAAARIEAGVLRRRLQKGEVLSLPHSRPIPGIGGKTWRIVYRTDADAIVIAEVLRKASRQTPEHVIDTCRRRLRRYDDLTRGDSMDEKKRRRLELAGWTVGSASDFIGLSGEETAFVELKLALSRSLRERRKEQGLSQATLARRIGSSQSRVAKMEASDPTVSLDLLVRGLLATGAKRKDIAFAIAPGATPSS
jgi:hypothetical protein